MLDTEHTPSSDCKVGIRSDNNGALATKFKSRRSESLSGGLGNDLAYTSAASVQNVTPTLLEKLGGSLRTTENDGISIWVEVPREQLSKERCRSWRMLRHLDDAWASSCDGADERANGKEPRIVPSTDNERNALGLFDYTRASELERQVGIACLVLVLHPFWQTLDCKLDLVERWPELKSVEMRKVTYVRHLSIESSLAQIGPNAGRDTLDIVGKKVSQLLEVVETVGNVLSLVRAESL